MNCHRFQYAALLVALSLSLGCGHAPPNLSPAGTVAFQNTRIVKTLDLLRDTAIAANEQIPPLLDTERTRDIVQFHESTLVLMQAARAGWQATALASLDELGKNLPPNQRQVVAPYVALAKVVLQEAIR